MTEDNLKPSTKSALQQWDNLPFLAIHLMCLGALFTGVTWEWVLLAVVSYYIRMVGVTAGYHRYFSHRSYKTGRVFQFLLACLAMTSAQKGVLWWAAHHRHHHRHSDRQRDLHSPAQQGFWYSHVGWILNPSSTATQFHLVKDLARYPELMWLNRFYVVPPFLYAALMYGLWGMPGLIWGFFISTTALYHGTFFINSLSHLIGRVLIYGTLSLWAFICLFPIYWTLTTSFKLPPNVMQGHLIPWVGGFQPSWLRALALSIVPLERPSQTRAVDWRIRMLQPVHRYLLPEHHFRWWYRVLPEAKLADALESSILMGFRVGELAWWRADDGLIYPDLKLHHGQNVRWNTTTQGLELMQRNGTPVPITPGDGRWVLFAPAGGDRPWKFGAVRALGIPYLIRQMTRRDWADRSEIEGTGIRKAKGPLAVGANDKRFTDFVSQIRRMGRKTVLALQEGWDFGIEVTDANAAILFEKLIAHSETAITLSILGQNLTTQIEGGSHAAATVHAKVLQSRLESDVAMLSVVCRDQILLPWCRYNLPNFDERTLPWPRWDAQPPEDKAKRAQALLAVSQAITGLRTAGVNIAPLLEQFELELEPNADPNADPNATDTKVPDAKDDEPATGDAAALRKHRASRRRG